MSGPRVPRPTVRFRVLAWLVIACVRLLGLRVRTRGLEHVPRQGGAVITWNHHSHLDFVLTAWELYRRLGRPVRYVAMRELWDHPRLGWVPRFADAIPVDRADPRDRDRALSAAVDALRVGHLVLVAPEGGISRSFELAPFRTGAVRMAQLAGVPVVPSASWGSHRLTTTGHGFSPRRARGTPVDVAFGVPLAPGPQVDPEDATDELWTRTRSLLEDVRAAYPDGAPPGAWWVPAALGGGAPAADPDRPTVHPRPGGTASGRPSRRPRP